MGLGRGRAAESESEAMEIPPASAYAKLITIIAAGESASGYFSSVYPQLGRPC